MSNPTFDLPPRTVAVVLGTRPEIIKLGHVTGLLEPFLMRVKIAAKTNQ